MVVIAIIRTSLAPLPNGIIDTSWLFFWQGIEAACAVIMVSLTSFRSLFGQQKKITQLKMEKRSNLCDQSNWSSRNFVRQGHHYSGSEGTIDGGYKPLLAIPSVAITK